MSTLITVIVPVFNIEKYLPRFFESMAAQTFRDYKLLVFDDGSEDNSLNICRKYEAEDERISVIPLEHMGITQVRNIAVQYISTEYTVWADGDDYVEADYLKHLVDAQMKYNADLVISRVMYHFEKDNAVQGYFPARGEMFISKEDFNEKLPILVDDRRLNYVYGKIYRSELLKNIQVEDDVKQGSDTMINCQYIEKAQNVVLIDDLDYHYIKYNNRSVTSYKGEEAFSRLCRINSVLYQTMRNLGYLSQQMLHVIDGRVLQSAIWVIESIPLEIDDDIKAKQISDILQDPFYCEAYDRQKGVLDDYSFDAIKPQDGGEYIKQVNKIKRNIKIKSAILRITPNVIIDFYHSLKG